MTLPSHNSSDSQQSDQVHVLECNDPQKHPDRCAHFLYKTDLKSICGRHQLREFDLFQTRHSTSTEELGEHKERSSYSASALYMSQHLYEERQKRRDEAKKLHKIGKTTPAENPVPRSVIWTTPTKIHTSHATKHLQLGSGPMLVLVVCTGGRAKGWWTGREENQGRSA